MSMEAHCELILLMIFLSSEEEDVEVCNELAIAQARHCQNQIELPFKACSGSITKLMHQC